MIPTAILAGLVVGRWWSVPVIGALWTALVLSDGDAPVFEAFAFGALNGAVGVFIHQVVRRLILTRRPRTSE